MLIERNFNNRQKKVNFKNILKVIFSYSIFGLLFILIIPINLVFILDNFYKDKIYSDKDKIPQTRVAIVFGAGLDSTATEPSDVLDDRIMSAVELYKAGKVQKILMSGDNRYKDYNEPQVMINTAKDNGVSMFDMQADYAGRRTYDTCYRAKYIFGIDKAILITQEYHLTRALYTCNILGIDAIGFVADKNQYQNITYFATRDYFALIKAYWDLYISPPEVVLGDKINF
jgi:vancomycin permeability regulator SanA